MQNKKMSSSENNNSSNNTSAGYKPATPTKVTTHTVRGRAQCTKNDQRNKKLSKQSDIALEPNFDPSLEAAINHTLS